jgi:hypothetical protein
MLTPKGAFTSAEEGLNAPGPTSTSLSFQREREQLRHVPADGRSRGHRGDGLLRAVESGAKHTALQLSIVALMQLCAWIFP